MWRPFGVDTGGEIAEYDALHEGVSSWLFTPLWEWVRRAILMGTRSGGSYPDPQMLSEMGQALRMSLPNLSGRSSHDCIKVLQQKGIDATLPIVDYLLAFAREADPDSLETILQRSSSAWSVGKRVGLYGLVRRVPEGVQIAADSVMGRAGRAGVRLAKAWELLYGLNPNPSEAYRHAILAIEDAVIPVVSPNNKKSTLGTVIGQMASDNDWKLPMMREPVSCPTKDVVLGMMRTVWEGQHDRHGGGEPSKPGNVSQEEANVAVLLAVAVVGWFDVRLVARR